jgi:hypothetical protein
MISRPAVAMGWGRAPPCSILGEPGAMEEIVAEALLDAGEPWLLEDGTEEPALKYEKAKKKFIFKILIKKYYKCLKLVRTIGRSPRKSVTDCFSHRANQ